MYLWITGGRPELWTSVNLGLTGGQRRYEQDHPDAILRQAKRLRQRMPRPPLATIATMILSSIHYIKALESFGGKAQ